MIYYTFTIWLFAPTDYLFDLLLNDLIHKSENYKVNNSKDDDDDEEEGYEENEDDVNDEDYSKMNYNDEEDYTIFIEVVKLVFSFCWLLHFPAEGSYELYDSIITNMDKVRLNKMSEFIKMYGLKRLMKVISVYDRNWERKIRDYIETETCIKLIH